MKGNRTASVAHEQSDQVTKTIEDILKVESLERTYTESIADAITTFFGSSALFGCVLWFSLWIIFNLRGWGLSPIGFVHVLDDDCVVEAIFLSAFILMSENRQGRLADRRARVNLQVDMISEREITKLMELVMDIHSQLGIKKPVDDELESMQKPTNIDHLTKAAQTAEEQNCATSSAKVTCER